MIRRETTHGRVRRESGQFIANESFKLCTSGGRLMGYRISDGRELLQSCLLCRKRWREGFAVLKPAIRSFANITHVPFGVFLSFCAPFRGGITIWRETVAARSALRNLISQ